MTQTAQNQFEAKVNAFFNAVKERDPDAMIQWGNERCAHPENDFERQVPEISAYQTNDVFITITSGGVVSKYAAWVNDAGQICGCRYV